MTDVHRPRLGEPNAPCRTCAAPLAEDQRYCLQCGTRRAEARLAFLEILERKAAATPAALEPAVAPARRSAARALAGLSTNAAAVAGVACLLLALGVGVLIGDHRSGDDAATAAPPAITVAAPAAAAAAVPATTTPAPAGATTTPSKAAGTTGASRSSSSSRSASRATNPAVEKLQSATGSAYQKQSARLPRTVGTGGKAPPKDDKPAAGGGSFEEIG